MWWRAFDTTGTSKASSVRRPQKKTDWGPHYNGAEHTASTGGLLVPRLREAWVPPPPALSPKRHGHVRGSTAPGRLFGAEAEAGDEFWPHFWQRIEDSELKRTKDSWRREQMLRRNTAMQLDPLGDSSLYDLKLHHNSAQRAKTVSLPTPPSSAPSGRASTRSVSRFGSSRQSCVSSRTSDNSKKDVSQGAPKQIRDLRVAFQRRQYHTANVFGISMRHLDDSQMLGVVDRLNVLAGDVGSSPGPPVGEYMPAGRQMTIGAAKRPKATLRPKRDRSRSFAFKDNLKEIFRKVREQSSTPVRPFTTPGNSPKVLR